MKQSDEYRIEWGIDVKTIENAILKTPKRARTIADETGLPLSRVRKILTQTETDWGSPYFDFDWDETDRRFKLWKLYKLS